MQFLLHEISRLIEQPEQTLPLLAAKRLGIAPEEIQQVEIVRKSIDARSGRDLRFKYSILIGVSKKCGARLLAKGRQPYLHQELPPLCAGEEALRGSVVVAGSGPAGLFAARLLAQHGYRPLVLERGARMEQREKDVRALSERGELNPNSNICFGEGGAGAFSDGKLTTRIKDRRVHQVLDAFVEQGAPAQIRYDALPHMGTEHIRRAVVGLREEILSLGGAFEYGARLCDLEQKDGRLTAAFYEQRGARVRIETGALVLAVGHSARDTFEMLHARGIALQQKPFAMGVRVEHRQEWIDARQYGKYAGHAELGAATYKLTARHGERGVYSFCMCPGGEVVCSATEPGATAVNGMSYYARDLENANSALVVSVYPGDMPSGPLGGVQLQRQIERAAYQAAGGYGAVAQRYADFVRGLPSGETGKIVSSYRPYIALGNIRSFLPRFLADGLQAAAQQFERKIPGFVQEGLLLGAETRTSCPLRILRGENFCAPLDGLYPAGEGAGYAGGILSSAVDGIKVAEAIIRRYRP